MSAKKKISFKNEPKSDEVYLEFQRHISWYSNTQCTVHITSDNYCSPLPHKTESVYCAFAEHRAVNSCAACILQTTVHGTTSPSSHLRTLQGIAADYVHSCSLISCWYNCWPCLCLLQEQPTIINISMLFRV